jgi:hypothetical protein
VNQFLSFPMFAETKGNRSGLALKASSSSPVYFILFFYLNLASFDFQLCKSIGGAYHCVKLPFKEIGFFVPYSSFGSIPLTGPFELPVLLDCYRGSMTPMEGTTGNSSNFDPLRDCPSSKL